jgi:hypothetical protein
VTTSKEKYQYLQSLFGWETVSDLRNLAASTSKSFALRFVWSRTRFAKLHELVFISCLLITVELLINVAAVFRFVPVGNLFVGVSIVLFRKNFTPPEKVPLLS